ncbi:MAG: hypothetical protein E7581_03260 [Ruminococcaceae bacterium]|nr:hypothetical protein [Oscillospiraceae bacterium]
MNKIVFGILTILFNSIGVPCFIQGNVKAGILRIVLGVVTCGVIGFINEIMGIILGIKVLMMSDEDFQAQYGTIAMGIPKGAPKAEESAE